MSVLLEVAELYTRYARVEVLHGVDLTVRDGETVVLLGPNGAGKTTLLRSISRTVQTSGRIWFDGVDLTSRPAAAVARLGVGHVPAGRGTFTELTVRENLRLGCLAAPRRSRRDRANDLDRVLDIFPALAELNDRQAGALSGGEQQMLAVGRALLGRPKLLLVDEPSLGLAPLVTRRLFDTLSALRTEWGLSVLLAEQNARLSLRMADRAYLLAAGQMVHTGNATDVTPEILHAGYLGGRPLTTPARSRTGRRHD